MRFPTLLLTLFRAACAALVFSVAGTASAQAPAQKQGVLSLTCSVGSFKMKDGTGTVTINFTGTVMVSQLAGTITPSGNLKLEYDKQGRKAYFGTGKLVINGAFRAVQWFGRNMSARWQGTGVVLLFGEFDKNLNTGWYWYDDLPGKRKAWQKQAQRLALPDTTRSIEPVERGSTGGGS